MPTMTAPYRTTRTYQQDDREIYADTGRPVDEQLGTHVVLWIVDDPHAWAKAIETAGDAQVAEWPKRYRHIGVARRDQAYASAEQVRAEGACRTVYGHHHSADQANACAADLYRSHPNPGVRYEVAAIEAADACPNPDCRQPRILAAGQWWHHSGRYPVDC